jgi:hypothetical protein
VTEPFTKGLAAGQAAVKAYEYNMMAPLRRQEAENTIKKQELDYMNALLNQRLTSSKLDWEGKTQGLRLNELVQADERANLLLKNTKLEQDDQTALAKAMADYNAGQVNVTPQFNTATGAANWKTFVANTQKGKAILSDQSEFTKELDRLRPRFRANIKNINPLGEDGRYTDEQWSQLAAAQTTQGEQLAAAFQVNILKATKGLAPGTKVRVVNPETEKMEEYIVPFDRLTELQVKGLNDQITQLIRSQALEQDPDRKAEYDTQIEALREQVARTVQGVNAGPVTSLPTTGTEFDRAIVKARKELTDARAGGDKKEIATKQQALAKAETAKGLSQGYEIPPIISRAQLKQVLSNIPDGAIVWDTMSNKRVIMTPQFREALTTIAINKARLAIEKPLKEKERIKKLEESMGKMGEAMRGF